VREARLRAELEELRARQLEARNRAAAARLASKALATYKAAQRSRLTADWKTSRRSADAAIIPDAHTLQDRARQLIRDDGYAKGIQRAMRRKVAGIGFLPLPQRKLPSGGLDQAFADRMKELWRQWSSDPRLVDRERKRNLGAVLRWCVNEFVSVGEALPVWSLEPRIGLPGLVLQCLEAEQLVDDVLTLNADDAGNAIELGSGGNAAAGRSIPLRGGVEVDEFGAALRYWYWPVHPADLVDGSQRPAARSVKAENVLHFFDPERARQTRGVTQMAPTMRRLRDLAEYEFSQLVAARAEAAMGLVIKQPLAAQPFGVPTPAEGEGGGEGGGTPTPPANDQLDTAPYTVARLMPGEDVAGFTPTRPGDQYEPFVVAQMRAASAAVGPGYEDATRDYSRGTYSSQRQGMIEAELEYAIVRDLLVSMVLTPLWRVFLRECVMNGLVRVEAARYAEAPWEFEAVEWATPLTPWVDPANQAAAVQTELEIGLTTLQQEAARRGRDWRELLSQRQIERQTIAAMEGQDQPAADADESGQVDSAAGLATSRARQAAELGLRIAEDRPGIVESAAVRIARGLAAGRPIAKRKLAAARRLMLQAVGRRGEDGWGDSAQPSAEYALYLCLGGDAGLGELVNQP